MPPIERSYKDLFVWQKGIDLSLEIYRLTDSFPSHERFSLTDQMRRAAVSIPSNIAEGRSRGTEKDFMNFLRIALGSAAELETQLIISEQLKYCDSTKFVSISAILTEVRKMLHGMIKKLGSNS